MLRKKPGHGRRHADDDDAPALLPSHPRDACHPLATPRRRLAPTPQTRNSHYFLLILLLVRASFYLSSSSSIFPRSSYPSFLSPTRRHLLFFHIYFLPSGTTMLHRIFSRSHLLLTAERRHFKRTSSRLSEYSSIVTNTVIFTYRVPQEFS